MKLIEGLLGACLILVLTSLACGIGGMVYVELVMPTVSKPLPTDRYLFGYVFGYGAIWLVVAFLLAHDGVISLVAYRRFTWSLGLLTGLIVFGLISINVAGIGHQRINGFIHIPEWSRIVALAGPVFGAAVGTTIGVLTQRMSHAR